MAADKRTAEQIRQEITSERLALAAAVESLRGGLDVTGVLRAKLPVIAAGALGSGFLVAGGVGATARLLMRRSREGKAKAKVGRFTLVDRG